MRAAWGRMGEDFLMFLLAAQLEHAARVIWGPESCSCMPSVLAACAKAQELVAVDPAYLAGQQAQASR